jgi:hypothetical protein
LQQCADIRQHDHIIAAQKLDHGGLRDLAHS